MPAMNRRWDTVKGRLFLGYALSLLAAVLLAMTPVLRTIHFYSSPHYDSLGFGHHHDRVDDAIAGLIMAQGSLEADSLSGHDHVPDHCPICQTLSTLGKHSALPGQPAWFLPAAALATPSPWHHTYLLSFSKSSSRSRAPPLS